MLFNRKKIPRKKKKAPKRLNDFEVYLRQILGEVKQDKDELKKDAK